MSVADVLRDATVSLSTISDTPRLDAELLMAHALGIGRNDLLLRQRDLSVPVTFAVHLQQRLAGAPIAHILGSRDFWTISLAVTPDVLIPRPDSETLIEAAVDHFRDRSPTTILDLGTGSGALLLAALALWRRRDARRLFAWSSIEHMGLAAFAAAAQQTTGVRAQARKAIATCGPGQTPS